MYNHYATTGVEPSALASKPVVSNHLQEYIFAFNILTTRRQVGMSKNPIAFEDILNYINSFGCTEPAVFVMHIIKMDLTYLQLESAKGAQSD